VKSLDDEKRNEVAEFLKEFKQSAIQNGILVPHRPKNQDSLIEIGFTKKDLENTILSLSVSDYFAGPVPDIHRRGEVWEFGKIINGFEIYIKLQIVKYQPRDEDRIVTQAKCISFHKAERPISYPFADPS